MDAERISRTLKLWNLREPLPENTYSVTEVTGCLRRTFFQRVLKHQQENNSAFLIGKLCHQELVPLVAPDCELEKEVRFHISVVTNGRLSDDITLIGHIDAVDKDTVYEFKFTGDVKSLPISYFHQANAYAVMAGKPRYKIIAVDKIRELEVNVQEGVADETQFQMLVDKAKELHAAIYSLDPPDGPSFALECRWCWARSRCWNGQGEGSPKSQEEMREQVARDSA